MRFKSERTTKALLGIRIGGFLLFVIAAVAVFVPVTLSLHHELDSSGQDMRYVMRLQQLVSEVTIHLGNSGATTNDHQIALVRADLEELTKLTRRGTVETEGLSAEDLIFRRGLLSKTEMDVFVREAETWLKQPTATAASPLFARVSQDAHLKLSESQNSIFERRLVIQDSLVELVVGVVAFSIFVASYVVFVLYRPLKESAALLEQDRDAMTLEAGSLKDQEHRWSALLANAEERLAQAQQELDNQAHDSLEASEKLQRALDHAEQASEIARFSASRFQELFQGIPVPAFTFDPQGTIFEWNHAASILYQKEGFVVFQAPIYGTVFPEDEWGFIRDIVDRVYAGETITNIEREEKRADGSSVWILSSFFPLRNPLDEVVGGVCASVDITERKLTEQQLLAYQSQIKDQMSFITAQNLLLQTKQAELEQMNDKLRGLATTDGLTGLKNHRAFQEDLETKFQHAKTKGRPISLLLFDVDKFKMFNDEFGHPAGDEVLKGVAQCLRDASHKGEYLARYGGEEFAIILAGRTEEQALAVAERFRQAIEAYPWTHRQVTASFGVSSLVPHTEERAALISMADEALYESKREGRNRSTCYSTILRSEAAA